MNDKDPKLERSAAENAAPEQTEGTPGKKPSAARARKKRELSERISGYSADYRGAYGERREMDNLPEDPEIDALVAQRTQAKKEKNWAEADRIRDELKSRGITVIDTPQGAKWRRE